MGTYYIDPNGSDGGNGSESSPWFSLDHASSQVGAGDTIIVKGGTYNYGSSLQTLGADGTSSNRVTVTNASGETPVFTFSGNEIGWEVPPSEGVYVTGDYCTVQGITIRDSATWGLITRNTVGVAFRDVECFDCVPGIGSAYKAKDLLIDGCYVHDIYPDDTGEHGDADGVVVNQSSDISWSTGVRIRNTRATGCAEDGYDLWDASGVVIENCMAGNNGSPYGGAGNGFKMGSNINQGGVAGSGNNTARRCVAWGNGADGFSDNVCSEPITVHNCTAWDNGWYGFRGYDESSSPHEFRNCVSYQNSNGQAWMGNNDQDDQYNTWNMGISDPQFKSLDSGSSDFLHLSSGSPCIDAGVDVGLYYNGDAPDLGAYERGQSGGDEPACIRVIIQ